MTSKWSSSGDPGGILRKPNTNNQSTIPRGGDLLVFGYACKIFRDDEKALHIDQGKHLIPWMGEKSLKIDRYDVRAALSDLSQYEPPPGGYTNRLDYLTPAEQRAEQLCEEERYHSLYHNEQEEQMYQEEELKRLHQERSSTYGQVQFDYSSQSQDVTNESEDKSDELDEVYTPPENFDIPPSIQLPDTMKLHAIIEKTAKFISTQGPQMEILIKAKQSNNPQFEFLNQNNRLNPYYKFILTAFKNGTYPSEENKVENDTKNGGKPTNDVVNINRTEEFPPSTFAYPTIPIPTIKYKPSANCAYTQLISKIKGVPLPQEGSDDESKKDEKMDNVQLLDYKSYYGVKTVEPEVQSLNNDVAPKPIKTESLINNANSDGVEVKKISAGLMLAQCYASDTEDENEHSEAEQSAPPPVLNFPIPPDHLQHIIDKTAIYVAKNGKQFEDILRTKEDNRFLFLDPGNEYHSYYMYKVTGVVHPYPTSNGDSISSDDKPKALTPVSFSIKSKEDTSVSMKPALPQETSDDENETKNNGTNCGQTVQSANMTSVPENIQIPLPLVENQMIVKGSNFLTNIPIPGTNNSVGQLGTVTRSRFDVDNTGAIVNRVVPVIPVLPVKLDTQKELKRAEEKVKDRLAQIAREKLGLISKEKQLQLERKKKAMVFLNQIKSSGVPLPLANSDGTSKTDNESDTDSSTSVHSIPIATSDEKINLCETIEVKDDLESITIKSTRSRSRSKSRTHRKKKKSKHHRKKKSKKQSRSRSRSRSNSDSRSHSHSESNGRKRRKRSSSRKSKKRRRE